MKKLQVQNKAPGHAAGEDGWALRFLYHTAPGRLLLKAAVCRPLSRLCGAFLDSSLSGVLIPGFVRRHQIRLSDYTQQRFPSFNAFFCREIKAQLRPIAREPDTLIAPCDGLLSAYRISGDSVLPIKQSAYTIPQLLGGDPIAARYLDGVCLVFRLCVQHYHRYCYLDAGEKGENIFLPGKLHTVRPIALAEVPVFTQNCREYTVMETQHFGTVTQVEVGAMLVGKIENHQGRGSFVRGQEKGLFRYGGSTVVLLLEKGRVLLPEELFAQTRRGLETPVHMGQAIGSACTAQPPAAAL